MSATVHTLRPIPGRPWIIHPADEARTLAETLAALTRTDDDTEQETQP